MDNRNRRKTKDDSRDNVPPQQVALEDAVPVAIFTFRRAEHSRLACRDFYGLYLLDDAIHLDAVGSDVLDGRCADFAWNVGEILAAVIIAAGHLGTEFIPLDA